MSFFKRGYGDKKKGGGWIMKIPKISEIGSGHANYLELLN